MRHQVFIDARIAHHLALLIFKRNDADVGSGSSRSGGGIAGNRHDGRMAIRHDILFRHQHLRCSDKDSGCHSRSSHARHGKAFEAANQDGCATRGDVRRRRSNRRKQRRLGIEARRHACSETLTERKSHVIRTQGIADLVIDVPIGSRCRVAQGNQRKRDLTAAEFIIGQRRDLFLGSFFRIHKQPAKSGLTDTL